MFGECSRYSLCFIVRTVGVREATVRKFCIVIVVDYYIVKWL